MYLNNTTHSDALKTAAFNNSGALELKHSLEAKRLYAYNFTLREITIENEKISACAVFDEFIDKEEHFQITSYSMQFEKAFCLFPYVFHVFEFIREDASGENRFYHECLQSSNAVSPGRLKYSTSNDLEYQPAVTEKAKQEAFVLQRISELQKQGLWSEKRLPKIYETPRIKAHWDYVLEEMHWIATDFAQERKWKKATARKCGRMMQKYFQDKEALMQRVVKVAESQTRKVASHMAKIIRHFWSNVEKLVEYKQFVKLEEKRKYALDQHLSFIVDQTEKYSSLVAKSMIKSTCAGKQLHSSSVGSDDDCISEFSESNSSSNGTESIKMPHRKMTRRRSSLRKSSNFRKRNLSVSSTDVDSDFSAKSDLTDDESTLIKEETIEGNTDHTEEIAELQADNDMSIEDLIKKYKVNCDEYRDDDKYSSSSSDTSEEKNLSDRVNTSDGSSYSSSEEDEDACGADNLNLLFNCENLDTRYDEDERINENIDNVAAIAESIQPKGNTLSSTNVDTKVPFLLKHKLREYQHIGLHWLVTMYERKLNGILADEMGLGKTIQTIALLAHLACAKGIWGPHLIIVPTSVMLNWEMEIKKWCPAFKILTYYGNPKERKLKRTGWTKTNAFHICITSYKLVVQDHHSFKRKKWVYLILDEAQNIKNFKSQRWQLLLNFQTERRLLLTGTPLQNNLMELWSLMHFLMPSLFASHQEFKEWFSNPVTGMIEGNSEYNENIIKRLHKILRPFLLRRLKVEVEKQLPKKYEHVILCRLSNRQRYLYDDFMSKAKTKETLAYGNLLNVINVLMQLRKVCNHPDLFEPRPIVSPMLMDALQYKTASLVTTAMEYDLFKEVNLGFLNFRLVDSEFTLSAWTVHRLNRYHLHRKKFEEIDNLLPSPPFPKTSIKINLKIPRDLSNFKILNRVNDSFSESNGTTTRKSKTLLPNVKIGRLVKTLIAQGEVHGVSKVSSPGVRQEKICLPVSNELVCYNTASTSIPVTSLLESNITPHHLQFPLTSTARSIQSSTGRQLILTSSGRLSSAVLKSVAASSGNVAGDQIISPKLNHANANEQLVPRISFASVRSFLRLPNYPSQISTEGDVLSQTAANAIARHTHISMPKPISISVPHAYNVLAESSLVTSNTSVPGCTPLPVISAQSLAAARVSVPLVTPTTATCLPKVTLTTDNTSTRTSIPLASSVISKRAKYKMMKSLAIGNKQRNMYKEKLQMLINSNHFKCNPYVILGYDVREILRINKFNVSSFSETWPYYWQCCGYWNCTGTQCERVLSDYENSYSALSNIIKSNEERIQEFTNIFSKFAIYVPPAYCCVPIFNTPRRSHSKSLQFCHLEHILENHAVYRTFLKYSNNVISFPDVRLIQYDCGKLQTLDLLLRKLKAEKHRALIFTQMTRMLDVLESFLNFHGYVYLRLDGRTHVEQRQILMERFNADDRYFCFILSTRSGGIGVNLTGADTVIFYDSDWNPTMDAQAQDRCHRIGQTRDVHIYRLVSEKTVEENILKKASQKRLLGNIAIEGGNFTTAQLNKSTIRDIFQVDSNETESFGRLKEIDYTCPGTVDDKSTLTVYERALAAVEDEPDVAATRTAKEEAVADLAEFDETIPIIEHEPLSSNTAQGTVKVDQTLSALIKQLTPVEQWAVYFMESVDAEWVIEQFAAAEAEIKYQKKEWELEREATNELTEINTKEYLSDMVEDNELTYSALDANNQVWYPLPVQIECDFYLDEAVNVLYSSFIIPDCQLPPLYLKKEKKKHHIESPVTEKHVHIRGRARQKEPLQRSILPTFGLLYEPPQSLFDRLPPSIIKLRHETRLKKYCHLPRAAIPSSAAPNVKHNLCPKLPSEMDCIPEWSIHEDYALLNAIKYEQEISLSLSLLYPGHVPNWDLASELVNHSSQVYRSSHLCRNRYEYAIVPRDDAKSILEPLLRKQKKVKDIRNSNKTTGQYVRDSNSTFSQLMNYKYDIIRNISVKRIPTAKSLPVTTTTKNPKHASILIECEIDYNNPLTALEVNMRRTQRIAKEKQVSAALQDKAYKNLTAF